MTFDYTGSYTLDTGTNVLTAYLTQTCNGETYEDTVIFNVVVSETTYTVTINVKDNLEIPEAIENASVVIIKGGVTVYNNQTNISGVINTYLSNGYYAVSITKDYYNSVSLFFTISDSNETINVTLSPNVELYSLSATTPVPGDTMTVNYVLLPNNKYEDECSIQYIVKNIEEEIVSNTTKLLSTLPDAYNQLDIDSGWSNGHTIEIILISTYDGDNVTGTITKTIGTMPIFYGVLSSISSPTSRTITNVIANELADIGDVGFNTELSYSGSGNLNVYFSDNITTVGYGWIAIPNNYEFLHCADKDEPTQSIDISNNFYSTGIVIGSTNYVVYMEMGTIPSSPFFGTLSPTNNWIFKS
jgi:hypothetical protein